MIPAERQELLRLSEEMSEGYPEFRLGQMIANLTFWARGDQDGAVWHVEDKELMAAAREQIINARQRTQPIASP
jgi:hypothetical protein